MATATIILTEGEDGDLKINVDFDPPADTAENAVHPTPHVAAVIAIEAIVDALGEH